MFPIFHFLMPVVILRALKVDKKIVFLLSPIAFLPDLDHIGVLLYLETYLDSFAIKDFPSIQQCRFKKNKITSKKTPKNILWKSALVQSRYDNKNFLFIAGFMFVSHILLDYSGVAFLWPISKIYYYFNFKTMSFGYLTADIINKGLLSIPFQKIIFHVILGLVIWVLFLAEVYVVYRIKNDQD